MFLLFWKTSKDFQINFFQRGRLKYLMITPTMWALPSQFAGLHLIRLINVKFLVCDALRNLVPLQNLKSVKNTHGSVLLLEKFRALV